MQDPNSNTYTYSYDPMGRKTGLTYPDSSTEAWSYDLAGNLGSFVNRSNNSQSFTYDGRQRSTGFTWNDGVTPNQTIAYNDSAHTATVSAVYPNGGPTITVLDTFNDDGSLASETESSSQENVSRTVSFTYDSDLRRLRTYYPGTGAHNFINGYTSRGQQYYINDQTANLTPRVFGYDRNENMTIHVTGPVVTTVAYNPMEMAFSESLGFTGGGHSISYTYDKMNDRTAMTREWGTDNYGYDLAEQTTTGPEGTYSYDANGNRNDNPATYVVNNLNQYTSFNGIALGYDTRGNLTSAGSSFTYDAQNRMTTAIVNGVTTTFVYDAFNRKFSQTTGGTTTVNVWDGWNLIEECAFGTNAPTYQYVYANGAVCERIRASDGAIHYYFQDALGSTSHVTDSAGNLIEYYKYDRFGQPTITTLNGQSNDIRHLFTGQLWMPQLGLYDMRNRVYSPYAGRFLQTDPMGFDAGDNNLYRYCGDNPVNLVDPNGLHVTIYEYPAGITISNPTGVISINYNHVGISINGAPSQGFYPTIAYTPVGPGVVRTDTGTPINGRSVTIPTTPQQDAAINNYIQQLQDSEYLIYDGLGNNCATFVEDALRAAGIKHVPKTFLPGVLIDKLQKQYPQSFTFTPLIPGTIGFSSGNVGGGAAGPNLGGIPTTGDFTSDIPVFVVLVGEREQEEFRRTHGG